MKRKLIALSVSVTALAGCGGGDVKITPSTNVTDSNNTVINNPGSDSGSTTNPCAFYEVDGVRHQGFLDGVHCVYGTDFVDFNNPLRVDLTIPDLPNDGAHIFRGSLFVGENQKGDQSTFRYKRGGEGPKLIIEAGATLAFENPSDFVVIHRGSQIIARGTAAKPITFTSARDVRGEAAWDDVSLWGGMIINGFGITNKCAYQGTLAEDGTGLVLENNTCDVTVEGTEGLTEASYGGNDNSDSSGELRYVIVKHTGAEIAPDNELNGITFGAVGSGTVVENVEAYSTYDDGIEFFGGAVNVKNYLALYVRDDSIDIDEGYRGRIENVLVIQQLGDGAHCVEADGIGGWNAQLAADQVPRNLHSQPILRNLTCIVTPSLTTAGATHEAGAGLMLREDIAATVENAIVTTAYQPDPSGAHDQQNYCLRHRRQSIAVATLRSSIIACADLYSDSDANTTSWAPTQAGNVYYQTALAGESPDVGVDNGLALLDGYYSLPAAQLRVGGANPGIAPQGGVDYIGGVSPQQDWTQGWTFGLSIQNWAVPLWLTTQ
ncbi:MAG: hypothetical protein KatS3mg124_1446 [Porticoccaceae bacterium]|nr:MAG: hypothetical protein KatS3mg124_1446 [Porticoccaceae bacterium]